MGGEGDAGSSPIFGQHPLHRRVVQAEDADGQDHARVCQEAAQDNRRRVTRVPLQVIVQLKTLSLSFIQARHSGAKPLMLCNK